VSAAFPGAEQADRRIGTRSAARTLIADPAATGVPPRHAGRAGATSRSWADVPAGPVDEVAPQND